MDQPHSKNLIFKASMLIIVINIIIIDEWNVIILGELLAEEI